MVRTLIPAEKLNKCHVNSIDGSSAYEPETEYQEGTVVTYQGKTYVANVDIEASDTDTPDEAAAKWALSPDAFPKSGEISDLEDRVSTLETEVGGIEDVLSAVDGFMLPYKSVESLQITANGVKTVSALYDELYAAFDTLVGSLEDNDEVMPVKLGVGGLATLDSLIGTSYFTKESGIGPTYYSAVNASSSIINVYSATFTGSGSSLNKVAQSSGTTTPTDLSSQVPADGTKVTLFYKRYRLI